MDDVVVLIRRILDIVAHDERTDIPSIVGDLVGHDDRIRERL